MATPKAKPGAVPTLAEMQRTAAWLWLDCPNCPHSQPVTLARYVILWGPDASSEELRRLSTCSQCGGKGARTIVPSWGGAHVGHLPFPG